MSNKNTNTPITAEELITLRAKLYSLEILKQLLPKLGLFLTIVGMALFIIYEMNGYIFTSIFLAGMFESIALMEVSNRFEKEFEALKDTDKKGVSDV
jgi:vacuolar-type H+-ATPase subunit I/STV1